MLRVVHIGLGPLGRRLLTDFTRRAMGRVVGVVDRDPDLVGRPVSEFVPGFEAGVVAPDVGALAEASGADLEAVDCAFVTTASRLAQCAPLFLELLGRGWNVISSCEELLQPALHAPERARELDAAARAGGARLLGTGINPGFLMDLLPIIATAVCNDVRRVVVERVQDASPRRLPFQRKIGATLTRDEFERAVVERHVQHVGLAESLHLVANALGWTVEAWQESVAPVIADRPLRCELGPISPGEVAGVEQIAIGRIAGEERIELRFRAAIDQPEPSDRVRVEGASPVEVLIPGGVHGDVGTTAMLLNSIAPLLAAPPGLHDPSTISVPRWSALAPSAEASSARHTGRS